MLAHLAAAVAAAVGAVLPLGGAQLTAAPDVRVPAGFRAEVYATGLGQPTAMAFGPDGLLYVTENGGRVLRVRTGSRRPQVVGRGFEVPLGLAWVGDDLYVSSMGRVDRLRNGRRAAVLTGLPFGRHQQDNIVLGPDGRLYLGSGSTCNACRERDRRSAAILSFRPDGSDLRVEASGLRNPYGLAFEPGTSRLWVSVNGRDDLGEWNPAESLVIVLPGVRRDFGWPGCWPDWRTRRLAGRCVGVAPHAVYLEPHGSANGIAFWRGDLFVAEWGQYNSTLHGREVVRVDLPSRRTRVFARGLPHPLALAVEPDTDALLVADWQQGRVIRIRRVGSG